MVTMIYWNNDSLLFATGLPLKEIAQLLSTHNELTIEEKLKQVGSKYLHRYETMKTYHQLILEGKQKLPIIPVIVGMPGVGKTAIAKELSVALNIGIVIGGDSLRSALRKFILDKEKDVFNSSIYDTWKVFGEKSTKTIIQGFEAQAKIMNQAIQRIIADRGFRDGESMIIEYLHFLPFQFDSEVIKHPSFMPLVLKITDEEIYSKRIMERSKYSHLRNDGERLLSKMDIYLAMQEHLCKEAKKNDIKIINIDNFEDGFDKSLDYIIDRIVILNTKKDLKQELKIVQELMKERYE
ncbi:MAG: AAA family ATPase [Asgard group archaeon]|nr:AAA family ATPase [Asgard group archaeon]